jgi:hypothetical protein
VNAQWRLIGLAQEVVLPVRILALESVVTDESGAPKHAMTETGTSTMGKLSEV